MDLILIAGLTFATVTALILIGWWVLSRHQAVASRLASATDVVGPPDPTLLWEDTPDRFPRLARFAARLPGARDLHRLADQAGWAGRSGEAFAIVILLAACGAALGWLRAGTVLWALASGVAAGAIPIVYLRLRRAKRLEKFSEEFPEALDMMTRSLRAGYAFSASIELVANEMPDPVASEFKRVFEQVSLGATPGDALLQLADRMGTEDVRFFYTAVTIQRDVGGNLAEILEKLSEVIRERFKLLSHARVLSAQSKASAYCVAASPFMMAIIIRLLSPGFFDPLLRAPIGRVLILVALVLQVIGFFVLKRVATITV